MLEKRTSMVTPTIIYNGRVESYVHSDSITENKCACIVRVDCQSEFGARITEFKAFCKRLAMLACGMQTEDYKEVVAEFPDLEQQRLVLEKEMQEKITIVRIVAISLTQAVWEKQEKKLKDLIPIMKAKRINFPLFKNDEKKEVKAEDLESVKERKFNPVKKSCSCGPNDECNICGDVTNEKPKEKPKED